jgi:pathogenesis-related protein 1
VRQDSGTPHPDTSDTGDTPSDPRMNNMLAAHNAVRDSGASPTPNPPLPPLKWSETLAADAKRYAAKCIWGHDSAELRRLGQGENLAGATSVNWLDANKVVNMWAAEVQFYNYANNSCQAGKMCGHYTQIVWRITQEVGCAMQSCPNGLQNYSSGRVIWVCRYSPPGNWIGQRPY